MTHYKRYLSSLPIAIPATIFLFFFMYSLASSTLVEPSSRALVVPVTLFLTMITSAMVYGAIFMDIYPEDYAGQDEYMPVVRDSISRVENEMGVVVAFASICNSMGYTITKIQVRFPDAVVFECATGLYLDVEFEYKASSFKKHNHNIDECDLIVCWIDDWKDCPLPVLALRYD